MTTNHLPHQAKARARRQRRHEYARRGLGRPCDPNSLIAFVRAGPTFFDNCRITAIDHQTHTITINSMPASVRTGDYVYRGRRKGTH